MGKSRRKGKRLDLGSLETRRPHGFQVYPNLYERSEIIFICYLYVTMISSINNFVSPFSSLEHVINGNADDHPKGCVLVPLEKGDEKEQLQQLFDYNNISFTVTKI